MELISRVVNEATTYKEKVRRRIDYFFLERMVDLLQSYNNILDKVNDHFLKYKAERDDEFYQKCNNSDS